jgi:hypothetical protein
MKPPFKQYERVRLRSDRFANDGAKSGNLGFVIEIYEDGSCEVEFSDANGITFAQIVAQPEELEACQGAE